MLHTNVTFILQVVSTEKIFGSEKPPSDQLQALCIFRYKHVIDGTTSLYNAQRDRTN